jgi:hypothetical protein
MKRRTLAEAELQATLNPMTNVQSPGRDPGPDGIGWPEITFAAGFLAAFVGVALVSVAAALVAAGVMLALLAWRLA